MYNLAAFPHKTTAYPWQVFFYLSKGFERSNYKMVNDQALYYRIDPVSLLTYITKDICEPTY